MLSVIYQISKNTFRENLREPIFLLLLMSALVLIGIYPAFTMFVFHEQVKLVVDSAMATSLLFGWIAAVLCASHAVAREIDSGTALLLLSKPVNRGVFITAKIIGILMTLVVFWFLTSLATLMAVRVAKDQFRIEYLSFYAFFGAIALSCLYGGIRNYFSKAPFPIQTVMGMCVVLPLTAFILYWINVEGEKLSYNMQLLPALVLLLYATMAMGTIATALSTRLDWVPNLLVCGVVFMIGLMSDYLIGRFAENSWLLSFLYAVVPNWQLFWMADALAAGKEIPWAYVGLGGLYMLMFVTFFVILAFSLFFNREVGEQSII